MTTNYVDNLDKKLSESDEKQEMYSKQKKDEHKKDKEITSLVTPILIKYKSELAKKGISVDLRIYDIGFSFMMHYNDGGKYGIRFSKSIQSRRYIFIVDFPSDDGKQYYSEDGGQQLKDDFTLKSFEAFLQSEIHNYMLDSRRHRGFL